ncbi:hypothetical protein GGS21DRAFT_546598 [Xylaria nigripes]|nr:hypothetical protein GGS21DRAFT_546598 [Xylaria nigripes]
MEPLKIGKAWSGPSIGSPTSNPSPPDTPLSCSTFSTVATDATTPIHLSFPNLPGTKIDEVSDTTKLPFTSSNLTVNSLPVVTVNGMPYTMEHVMMMGQALAEARREKRFPSTTTPGYNVQATIDDYEDLERLNAARQGQTDTRDDAFRPDISSLYIKVQRRIQDRDLTHGEISADSNVRARLNGLANGTGAEASMYNLMRHAVNSVLRLNKLTADSDSNIVDAVASRVVGDIRATVQSQAACGTHGVDGGNMDNVMENVFNAIEDALNQGVGVQANRLNSEINNMTNNMSSITDAQNIQVNAIASHVNAIDNHVHAMGNNVNAMGTLLNSTNGNVTTLGTSIGTLQTIVNMLPQMVTNSVQEMLPEVIGPAVEQAFAAAISNELVARLQAFTRAAQAAQAAQARGNGNDNNDERKNKGAWFNKLNVFGKRSNRR